MSSTHDVSLPTVLSSTLAAQPLLEVAGKLHARAGAGTLTLVSSDDIPTLIERLKWVLASTAVTRLQLQRPGAALQQGELAI